jgi:hypothetical protein
MMRLFYVLKPWLLGAGFWVGLMLGQALADDWVTTDGKTYENVSVVKVEDDAVTILHKNGGALVPLDKLPPDLQQKFHYDPLKAKVAAAARAKKEAADAKALADEKARVDRIKQQKVLDDAKAQEAAKKKIEEQGAD